MLSMPRIVRPDLFRLRGTEVGFPVGPATRQPIKRNKELTEASNLERSQSSRARPDTANARGDTSLADESHLVAGDESQAFVKGATFIGGVKDYPIDVLRSRPFDESSE
jgi:hypothetical protein